MMGAFNPRHGDLGRAERLIPLEDFSDKALKAAHFIRSVAQLARKQQFDVDQWFRYAIEINAEARTIEGIARSLPLPSGVEWYEMNDQIVFEMRGYSGGVVSCHILYLVCDPMKV